MAILRPNGAGKSSFLKLLTGEVRPEADPARSCRLFGEELWSLQELRHRIGVGDKQRILTSERLSSLYQVKLRATWSGGWCGVRPA